MDKKETKELVDDFRSYLAGSMAALTADSYASDVKLMLATMDNDLGNMTRANVRKFVEYGGHEERSAPSTQVRHRAAARAFLKFLKIEKRDARVPPDVCENIRTQRMGRRIPECLTVQEVEAVLESVGDNLSPVGVRNRAMVEVMYSAGLRVDELTHLRIGDLSFGEDMGKARIVGKGNKERIALVSRRAMDWLEIYLGGVRKLLTSETGPNSLVFVSCRGNVVKRKDIWLMLRKAAERAGIEPTRIHPHVFRHSFATHLLTGGANLMVIKELLGHASIATTQIYLTVSDRDKVDAYMKAFPKLG